MTEREGGSNTSIPNSSKTLNELKEGFDRTIEHLKQKHKEKVDALEEKLLEKTATISELEKAMKEMELFTPAHKLTKTEAQELQEARNAYRSWTFEYDNGRVRIKFLVDPLAKEINSLSFEDLR